MVSDEGKILGDFGEKQNHGSEIKVAVVSFLKNISGASFLYLNRTVCGKCYPISLK